MDLFEHVTDHPWPGCQVELFGMRVTWMSSGIASMLLVAAVLLIVLPLLARRAGTPPKGGYNVLEVLVLFVRDRIARPALHERTDTYLPILLTLFVFVLGMNLVGLFPLEALSRAIPGNRYLVGTAPTMILTVCGGLGGIALLCIVLMGMWRAAGDFRERHGGPVWLGVLLSPLLWVTRLSPEIPGLTGIVLSTPLALLELLGALFKCFALMVRLFANILAGHFLLAVLMMFLVEALLAVAQEEIQFFYVGPICVIASVAIDLLELLMAGLQAYIYTFLLAMFLGLYVEAAH